MKITQSRSELIQHLKEQIHFLESSSKSYDDGFEAEARRLATVIRVLVHDTPNSKSLLEQLDKKNIPFLDTSYDIRDTSITRHGLVLVNPTKGKFVPRCHYPQKPIDRHTFIDFETWWNKVVIIDKDGNRLSRKYLVLKTSNQDGGAHVDPKLDETYAKLTRSDSSGWTIIKNDEKEIPFQPIGLASLRQIAHEVIESLKLLKTKI